MANDTERTDRARQAAARLTEAARAAGWTPADGQERVAASNLGAFLETAMIDGAETVAGLHQDLVAGTDVTVRVVARRQATAVKHRRRWSYTRWWTELGKPEPPEPWARITPGTTLEEVLKSAVWATLDAQARAGWDEVRPYLCQLDDATWQAALSGAFASWELLVEVLAHPTD